MFDVLRHQKGCRQRGVWRTCVVAGQKFGSLAPLNRLSPTRCLVYVRGRRVEVRISSTVKKAVVSKCLAYVRGCGDCWVWIEYLASKSSRPVSRPITNGHWFLAL